MYERIPEENSDTYSKAMNTTNRNSLGQECFVSLEAFMEVICQTPTYIIPLTSLKPSLRFRNPKPPVS